jgi:hypothetical protein
MADYHSVLARAVTGLDLNTPAARRRLYERARIALSSEMHGAYPRFHRSEIAAAEMSLEMAIEAVEAQAVREQNAKLATPAISPLRAEVSLASSPPANQNGSVPSAEPLTAPRATVKRYQAIPTKTAPIGVNVVIPG